VSSLRLSARDGLLDFRELAVSPFAEVQLITARELRKSFRSVKGIVLAAMSLAGGAGVAMLFAWVDRAQHENMPQGIDPHVAREAFFTWKYGDETGKRLAECPYSLWMMLMGTLWLAPLLVALLDFDAVSGDLQYRSVRFWTVRVRRSSYMLGKYLGAWFSVLAVTFGMNVVVWGATAAVGDSPLGTVLGWGIRFFAVSIPIGAAWCGIATLVGSQAKSPMLSLLFICGVFFGLWMLHIVADFSQAEWVGYLYPNSYDGLLLSAKAADLAKGLLGPALIAGLTVAAATAIFERRDV
jgi:ABC-type transport system involved in multi-copper enzyme maturation permease subunit